MSSQQADPPILQDQGQGWLREHALQLLVMSTASLTAGSYLVGRAGIQGWYDAAGVPSLWFVWPFQDIVIRGLVDSSTWVVVAGAILVVVAYFVALESGSTWLSKRVAKWRRLRTRGERSDRLKSRKRRALQARQALRMHDSVAIGIKEWRRPIPGRRGVRRVETPPGKGKRWRLSKPMTLGLMAVGVIISMFSLYVAAIVLLYERPYRIGVDQFRKQYVAATGRQAPARRPPGWRMAGQSPTKVDDAYVLSGREQLGGYPYVRLSSKGADGSNARICGWLVQAAEGRVLLLTSDGLSMKNFGDGAFEWDAESPGGCR